MKLILFGAPGSGKGTQAENIRCKLNIPAISTGNILRAAIADKTETGLEAKSYVDAGKLVPDSVMLKLIKERLAEPDCTNGFILDGYPRTIVQAESLDEAGVMIDAVLSIEISDQEIENRLTGRRVCKNCGRSYHTLYNPPSLEGACDDCSGSLIRREDDEPETVRNRLRVYHESTEPLKGFYEQKGILRTAVSHEDVSVTTARSMAALGLE